MDYKQRGGKCLDGTYTRLLVWAQNLSWKSHPTKAEIIGEPPPISKTVAERRARFAGLCFRAKDQLISDSTIMEATLYKEEKQTSHLS